VQSFRGWSPWPWLSASVASLTAAALRPQTSQTNETEKMSALAGEGNEVADL
jgi:hypothetical protein